jgi:hypothetical protein
LGQHDGELRRYVATTPGVAVEPSCRSPDQFSAAVELRNQEGDVLNPLRVFFSAFQSTLHGSVGAGQTLLEGVANLVV